MKKITLAIIVFCSSMFALSAQTEIYMSAGIAPQGKGAMPSVTNLSTPLNPGQSSPMVFGKQSNSASFNIGLLHDFIPTLALGLQYSYYHMSVPASDIVGGQHVHDMIEAHSKNHVFMVVGKEKWFSTGRFTFYSKVGAGLRFSKTDVDFTKEAPVSLVKVENKTKCRFAYQASFLGIEYELIPHFGVFVEGGVGNNGCFLAGVKASF